jgi:phage shock protein A
MTENLTPPSVPEMLRLTGANQADFMQQVADHVEKLEQAVVELQQRITELENLNEQPK